MSDLPVMFWEIEFKHLYFTLYLLKKAQDDSLTEAEDGKGHWKFF